MRPIISVRNLSKQYRIGAKQAAYGTLRDSIAGALRNPFRRNGSNSDDNTIWALKDISFDVMPGEVVGIIGRNGAGKSTLLKILSRITEPTSGEIDIYGRVGSLLEVGTGFHAELSGRENLYLNGAVLGMKRREIDRKFDEIVDFAEIEKFIDTPVKRYSSGMYMRLAFAVAAHLEPEILIVDEVLAVGDKAFQLKCLNKMQDISGQGRTVLFVSHDVSAVTRLCHRGVLLDSGKLIFDDKAEITVSSYFNMGKQTVSSKYWGQFSHPPGNDTVRLYSVRACSENGETIESIAINKPVGIEITYEVQQYGFELVPNIHLFNAEGVCLFISIDHDPEWAGIPRPPGRYVSTAWVPENFLAEGKVVISAAITTFRPFNVHLFERDVIAFQVVDSIDGGTARGDYAGVMPGVIRPILKWTTNLMQHVTVRADM